MVPSALLLVPCLAQGLVPSPAVDAIEAIGDVSPYASPAIGAVSFDEPGDGRLWVRGSNYKASFGAEGATFVPFLGSDASRNWPATFQLDEVMLGGQPLELASTQRSREEDLVTLDRGSVSERYEIALDSIEQSFAFESLPGSGELVLRLGVESDLEPVADGAGWRFEGPEGGFDYGAATVLDAAGTSLALESEWDGRALVFRVPADFVAAATLPIVVDPVISAGPVADLSADERSADVAYDPTWGNYMVSVEYVFSTTDSDVRVYTVSGTAPGTLGTNGFWIDMSTSTWRRPRIACRNQGNAFMIVATVGTTGSKYVAGRVRDVDVAVTNPPFVVSGTLDESMNPDVGGDGRGGFASGAPGFVVVWEKAWVTGVDHDIYMRSYSNVGQPLTQPTAVEVAIGQYLKNPVISKSAGPDAPYEYLVAWENRVNASRQLIQARRVSVTGAGAGQFFTVTTSGISSQPEVSAISNVTVPGESAPAAVVVYTHQESPSDDTDIRAIVCSGDTVHPATNITVAEGSAIDLDQHSPSVSCDGDQWVVAFAEQRDAAVNDFDVYMTTVNLVGNGLGLSEPKRFLATSASSESDTRIASKWAAGLSTSASDANESFVVWTDERSGGEAIEGGHVATYFAPACGAQYCRANENSTTRRGWLSAFGDASTTSSKTLWARYLPLQTVAFFLVSASTGDVPNVSGSQGNLCLGPTGFGRYANAVGSTGAGGDYTLNIDPTQIPQPTTTVPAVSGQTWYFQCWHRDQVGGAATSNLTNAVAIPFQ